MKLIDWIGVGSGVLSLLGAAYTAWTWSRSRSLVMRRQDPSKLVTKEILSYEDIRFGMETLLADAREFQPDLIVGINRGGAIIGGILAKKLDKSQIHILALKKTPDEYEIHEHWTDRVRNVQRILLTDDALRSGDSMREASKYLKKKFPAAELRRLVLLKLDRPQIGSSGQANVEKYVYQTRDSYVKLAWDI